MYDLFARQQLSSYKRRTMRLRTIGAHYYVPNTYQINAPAKTDEIKAELTLNH